jgi:hypothetical protein
MVKRKKKKMKKRVKKLMLKLLREEEVLDLRKKKLKRSNKLRKS